MEIIQLVSSKISGTWMQMEIIHSTHRQATTGYHICPHMAKKPPAIDPYKQIMFNNVASEQFTYANGCGSIMKGDVTKNHAPQKKKH